MSTNSIPLKPELPLLCATIIVGSILSWAVFKAEEPPTLLLPNFTAIQDLEIDSLARDKKGNEQNTSTIAPGKFVHENFYYFQFSRVGDWLRVKLPSLKPGEYVLTLKLATAGDFGVFQIILNGTPIGHPLNLFNTSIAPLTSDELRISLTGEKDILELRVIDKDPLAKAPYYQLGIDGLILVKTSAEVQTPQ